MKKSLLLWAAVAAAALMVALPSVASPTPLTVAQPTQAAQAQPAPDSAIVVAIAEHRQAMPMTNVIEMTASKSPGKHKAPSKKGGSKKAGAAPDAASPGSGVLQT